MRKLLFVWGLIFGSIFCAYAQKYIAIENKTDRNRSELIAIPFAQFSKHFGVDTIFSIEDFISNNRYVHQLETKGTSKIQNVLIQVEVPAHSTIKLSVHKKASPSYPSKVFARYVPERFDDFAWENDVVAFRVYGKALEGRRDDAQGMDYWAKRTSDLIIDKWYAHDDYHRDHGDGLDYYSVGQTLGAGYLAMFIGDSLQYSKHYRDYQILDNGPLRTTFKLMYEKQDYANNSVSMEKIISIDAGQQFNKILVHLYNSDAKHTPVVVGLARRGEDNPAYRFDRAENFLTYWEPAVRDHGRIGTALVVPNSSLQFITADSRQFLLKTTVKNGKPLLYYTGAAWNKAGKITSADEWENHVKRYVETVKNPLKVKLR